MSKMRIVLVDDHEVVRLGLKVLLEQSDHFEVVGEANNAKEAVEITGKFRPDIVLMDIRLPGASGIEACEEITQLYPEVRVVMLTSYAEDEMLFSAIRAGASGYRHRRPGLCRTSARQPVLRQQQIQRLPLGIGRIPGIIGLQYQG